MPTSARAVHEQDWPSIPEMSRTEVDAVCPQMRVVHSLQPKAIGKEKICARRGRSGRGAAKKSRASARNMTRLQAHLFAYFFWRNRKSRSAKQRLRCYRINGSPVNPDKRTDVHPQGVGRIRSAPSSLTAALAIGPYKLLCRIVCEATAAVSPQKRHSGAN